MIQRVCDRAGCSNLVNNEKPHVLTFGIGIEGKNDINSVMDLCDECAELLDQAFADDDTMKAMFKMLKTRRTRKDG